MSITLEFYPVAQCEDKAENLALLFKQFNDEMNQALQLGEASQFIALNASECITFHIANLSFMKALKLAQFVNKDVNRQINELIKEHMKWACKRLYYGLCCYVNDSMYSKIATSPTYVRDLAACFRMAVFNKAITSNIHNELWQFVISQPIATVMLAVSNFEQESETITLMRKVHQLAIKTLYVDCCEWYKISFPAWNPEYVRPLEYTYQHHMWLDTLVVTYPAKQNYPPEHKKVPVVCLITNPMMTEALARFEFLKVEILLVEPRPTFDQIQIGNLIFERELPSELPSKISSELPSEISSKLPSDQQCDTLKEVDKFDITLLQIKQCQLKLQAPVNYCVPLIKSTLCQDIQDLLASMK